MPSQQDLVVDVHAKWACTNIIGWHHLSLDDTVCCLACDGVLHAEDARAECLGAMQVSEATGCAILPGTAAYLECSVADKLEAGDHWVVYATVEAGKVTEEGALSAVHHRKIGTTY